MGRKEEPFLGVLLTYSADSEFGSRATPDLSEVIRVGKHAPSKDLAGKNKVGIGLLGAGNFAQGTLLPALKSISDISLIGVCNATGARSRSAAEKFGFSYCSNSEDSILRDPKVDAVVIATRHNLHARQALAALQSGKSVFCEKPLCLDEAELASLIRAVFGDGGRQQGLLMVGFNRRFAPMAVRLKKFLSEVHEPLSMHYRVNAGYLPADHWVNDAEEGGGRILGEVCHFVDFLCFLASASPTEVQANMVGNSGSYSNDNIVASLKFANGSLGTISYMANGDKVASKERLEVFGGASVAILEDFRHLELVRHGRKQTTRARWLQDKGHKAEMRAFVAAVQGKVPPPIPFEEIVASTLATLRLQNACQVGETLKVDIREFIASALQGRDESTAGELS
jgi:predicted dehydrogenase